MTCIKAKIGGQTTTTKMNMKFLYRLNKNSTKEILNCHSQKPRLVKSLRLLNSLIWIIGLKYYDERLELVFLPTWHKFLHHFKSFNGISNQFMTVQSKTALVSKNNKYFCCCFLVYLLLELLVNLIFIEGILGRGVGGGSHSLKNNIYLRGESKSKWKIFRGGSRIKLIA